MATHVHRITRLSRIIAFLLIAMSVCSAAAPAATAATTTTLVLTVGKVNYTLNGKTLKADQAPEIKDSRTFVPIRLVSEAFGADVNYDAAAKKVEVLLGATSFEFVIGQKTAKINGDAALMDAAAYVSKTNRTLIPVRFVSEKSGLKVVWNATARTVTITGASVAAPARVSLTISAASSMTDAMNAIQKLYQAANPHVTLVMNYGSSGTLEQQIEQGAPADLFISAADKQMNMLEQKSLILTDTRTVLVRNRLVLIVPKGTAAVTGFGDLTKASVKFLAIGEPSSVPAGQYAQETLTSLGLWEQVQPKLVRGNNVRAVLTYVESGNADAGLVYSTDALTSHNVKVIATAAEDSHSPIVYPAAVISTSKHQAAARAFVAYLSSALARAVFLHYGFVMGN